MRSSSVRVRRSSVGCGIVQSGCGVGQSGCGVVQLLVRRLAIRQAELNSRLGAQSVLFDKLYNNDENDLSVMSDIMEG